jgi:hypothetical protein
METVFFNNQIFKVREIDYPNCGNVLISTIALNELLMTDDATYSSEEARIIDEQIFYFVEDDEIELDEKDLTEVIIL